MITAFKFLIKKALYLNHKLEIVVGLFEGKEIRNVWDSEKETNLKTMHLIINTSMNNKK